MSNPIFNTQGAINDDNPLQVEIVGGGGGGTSGGATEAKQDVEITALGIINTTLGSQATATQQDELLSEMVFIKNTLSRSTNMFFHRDTSFVTGDSPTTHALGFTSQEVSILNDGVGNLQISFSTDGSTFGSAVVVFGSGSSPSGVGEAFRFENVAYTHVRITWVADTSYRLQAQ